MKREAIFEAIAAERQRQSEIWGYAHDWGFGDCSSTDVAPEVKVMVLAEEVGEVARCVLDHELLGNLREELVQVAGVAVAWLEAL